MKKKEILIIILSLICAFFIEKLTKNYFYILILDCITTFILIYTKKYIETKKIKITKKRKNILWLSYLINLTSINLFYLIFNIPLIITKLITIIILISLNKKENKTRYIPYLILLNLSIFFGLNSSMSPIGSKNSTMDSSVFRYIGLLMTKGKIPYIDVFDHKGILLYFINYIAILINKDIGIWYIEVLFIYLSSIFAYKTANLFCNKKLSLIVTITSFISLIFTYNGGGNYTEEYALLFIMISLYYFYKDITKDKLIKTSSSIIIGMSLGAVLLLRPNMIAVWIVMSIYLLIIYIKTKKLKELIKLIATFLLGILIFITPFIIYLIHNKALIEFFNQYIIFNFKYSSLHKTSNILLTIFYFIKGCKNIIISILVILISLINGKEKPSYLFLSFYMIILSFILVVMPTNLYNHYAIILIPLYIYPLSILFKSLDSLLIKKKFSLKKIMLIFISGIIIINIKDFKYFGECIKRNTITEPHDKIVIDYIIENSKPKDNILVYGNKVMLYLKTNRFTTLKYPYQEPITTVDEEISKDFKKQLIKEKPKLIIVPIEYYEPFIKKINNQNNYYEKISIETSAYTVYKLK